MVKPKKLLEMDWTKQTAKKLFNHTWDLIDKGKKRTPEDNESMIHAAHTSRYLWGLVVAAGEPNTGPVNLARGDWQISRVYALVNRPHAALYHGKLSLDRCVDNKIGGFDLAFGYEAVARAYALLGDKKELETHLSKAQEAANKITKKEDREYVLGELGSIPK